MTSLEPQPVEEIALPVLLSAARRPYGRAIRQRLAAAGFDDMPERGIFVIAAIARHGPDMRKVAPAMGVSKQAVSQLVDTLVTRGYLERAPDPADRRRMSVAVTERGLAAAQQCRAGVEAVDAALEAAVGAEALHRTRQVLGTLAERVDNAVG